MSWNIKEIIETTCTVQQWKENQWKLHENSLYMMQTWWTDYPTILEPSQNSRRQKSNNQQCPYCGRTRIRRRRTSICHSELAPVICASLFQPTSLSCLCGFNRSARADLYWLIPASILGVRTDGTALLIARLMVIFKTYIKILKYFLLITV
jgi:hypothetical protein